MVLVSPIPINCRLPAPLLALVSNVIGPTGDGLRPFSKNMVERNESEAACGLGLGDGVGVGVGVGVAGELETEPQPQSSNKNPENKTRIMPRKKGLLNLCWVKKGNVSTKRAALVGRLPWLEFQPKSFRVSLCYHLCP